MPKRQLPETASVAISAGGAKLVAPSFERNVGGLCDLLSEVASPNGKALELASGTGQHVCAFAAHLPGLNWQPTDIDQERCRSIDAYAAESGLTNIAPALALDATRPGWGARHSGQSLIVLVNLMHLISTPEAGRIVAEVAQALTTGGRLVIYGPFKRSDELTSEGDVTFHASLIARDPEIGYKDDFDMMDMIQAAGMEMVDVVEMPANNLVLVAEKPAI